MVSKNNNNKIIKKLAINDFKANRLRNIFVIFAVVLTTLLIVSITSGVTTFNSLLENEMAKMKGTSDDLTIQNISYESIDDFANHKIVNDSYVISNVSEVIENDIYERTINITYKSEITDIETGLFTYTGDYPKKDNEIVLSQTILDALDNKYKIGDTITFEYILYDELIVEEFKITGIYTPTAYETYDMVFISKSKFEKIIKDDNYIFRENGPQINVGLYLDNVNSAYELNSAITTLSEDLNYNFVDEATEENYKDQNTVTYYSHHSVITTNDAGMYVFAGIIIFFVVLSGFLMISSIFESSIVKDMETFAQLKTIGATKVQIRNILIYQGLILSVIAIPISLVINLFTIDYLTDTVINSLNVTNEAVSNSSFIAIIIAIVFSLLTVYISIVRSYRIISKKTPVEMYKYNEVDKYKRKSSNKKLSIIKIGQYNAKRNKFKYFSIVTTLTIIPILLLVFFTIGFSFDKDKFVKEFAPSDVIVRLDTILDTTTFSTGNQEITKNAISEFDEFEKSGEGSVYLDSLMTETIDDKGNEYVSSIYSIDKSLLSKFKVIDGKINYDLYENENYVIVIDNDESDVKVGEKLKVKTMQGHEVEYEVLALVELQYEYSKQYSFSGSIDLIMSENSVNQYNGDLNRIVYAFDTDDESLTKVENHIANIKKNYKHLKFSTTDDIIKKYEDAVKTYTIPTTFLCGILLLIAISNYVNTILVNIITKQKEYAIMKSIGMTSKQYRLLILSEGMSAVIKAAILSFIIGGIISVTFVRQFIGEGWVSTYNPKTIIILPLATLLYIIILLPIPLIIDKLTSKKSIVESIRE